MSKIVSTKRYIWRIPDKIYFVTFRINERKQFKLSIDIRNKPIGSKSDNINDYKERDGKIVSGWINYRDNISKTFQDISGSRRFIRPMSEIAFDYYQLMHVNPKFSHASLFKRKYLEIPYPSYNVMEHDEEYECNEINEFWLCGNNKMEITLAKFRTYYRNITVEEENDIINTDNDSTGICDIKDQLGAEYPKAELAEWALEEIFIFYKPRIHDEVVQIISYNDLARIVVEYVLS